MICASFEDADSDLATTDRSERTNRVRESGKSEVERSCRPVSVLSRVMNTRRRLTQIQVKQFQT
jgi:hypothetical protein